VNARACGRGVRVGFMALAPFFVPGAGFAASPTAGQAGRATSVGVVLSQRRESMAPAETRVGYCQLVTSSYVGLPWSFREAARMLPSSCLMIHPYRPSGPGEIRMKSCLTQRVMPV